MRCEATEDNSNANVNINNNSSSTSTAATTVDDPESREVLDAFYLGKALAETLLERAGGVFADTLGEIAKFDAERRWGGLGLVQVESGWP